MKGGPGDRGTVGPQAYKQKCRFSLLCFHLLLRLLVCFLPLPDPLFQQITGVSNVPRLPLSFINPLDVFVPERVLNTLKVLQAETELKPGSRIKGVEEG